VRSQSQRRVACARRPVGGGAPRAVPRPAARRAAGGHRVGGRGGRAAGAGRRRGDAALQQEGPPEDGPAARAPVAGPARRRGLPQRHAGQAAGGRARRAGVRARCGAPGVPAHRPRRARTGSIAPGRPPAAERGGPGRAAAAATRRARAAHHRRRIPGGSRPRRCAGRALPACVSCPARFSHARHGPLVALG